MSQQPLRLGVIGAGFWAELQVHAWQELAKLGGVELTGICNRTRAKAEDFKTKFGFKAAYSDPQQMLAKGQLDVVDIITSTESHKSIALTSLKYGLPVIVQKPIASTLKDAREMVNAANAAGIPLIVHENYRWWAPVRKVKAVIESGLIGELKDLIIHWKSGAYDYYENQPYFKGQPRFIIGEVGVHLVDIARFLAGCDVQQVYAHAQRFNPEIKGEDFARIVMKMTNQATVSLELGVETLLEHEQPPAYFITATGSQGTIELGPDFRLAVTQKKDGEKTTEIESVSIPSYPWADAYPVALACMVPANRHYLAAIVQNVEAETSGRDNLNTIAATMGAYLAAETNQVIDTQDLESVDALLEERRIGYPDYPN